MVPDDKEGDCESTKFSKLFQSLKPDSGKTHVGYLKPDDEELRPVVLMVVDNDKLMGYVGYSNIFTFKSLFPCSDSV